MFSLILMLSLGVLAIGAVVLALQYKSAEIEGKKEEDRRKFKDFYNKHPTFIKDMSKIYKK